MSNSELVDAILAAHKTSTDALARILPELNAIERERLRPVNLDVPVVVSRVLGAAANIITLREDIACHTPTADLASIEKLPDYANALREAHTRCLSARSAPVELHALADAGQTLRDVLRTDAAALIKRGLLDAARLESCKGQPGYVNISTELSMLAGVMESCWPQIEGKTAVSVSELQRARGIADALLAFAGARVTENDESTARVAAATDVRARAFTLVIDKYDDARRVVTYLRWKQGDAEKIAPSLFGGKNRSRKGKKAEDPQDVSVNAPAGSPVTEDAARTETVPPAPVQQDAPVAAASQTPTQHFGPRGNPFMQ